jgi:PST family polysaccharide transporter
MFTIFAPLIVHLLYGEEYMPTVPVLQILVWNTAFSYMGYVRNIWILGEEKHKILWVINASGAVANILLNVWLIPLWGACGAAVASVLTQIFTNFVLGFILKEIRANNRLILKSLNPKLLLDMVAVLKK